MQKLTYSIGEVQAITGLGRTRIYELINSGVLPARKLGKRTLILKADLEAFLAALAVYDAKPQGGQHGGH